MQINKQEMLEFADIVANAVVAGIKEAGILGNVGNGGTPTKANKDKEKTAYAKTESLLYNYNGFLKIIKEREAEIAEIRKYGVPGTCGGVKEFVQKGGMPQGIVLPEESVDNAVRNVQASVEDIVQVVSLINNSMAALKTDPYYAILEMRYFQGRTQEDIAVELSCTQQTISKNKSRLVRELSMRLFPDQVIDEMMH